MPRSVSLLAHDALPYRPCVGIMLINPGGLVFVGRRIDQTVEGWQMPQGGIDEGETPAEAGLRELKEEIGTDKAVILREMDEWLCYDLPRHLVGVALHGRFRGQKQKWLAMRFTGNDGDIDIKTAHPEFAAWKWLTMDELPDLIVPFKRDTYQKVIAAFRDLAKPQA
jgi:putative (di)nucleoside polyphosphate hydrolase